MSEVLDLAVVGAGPCGIAVGAAAAKADLRTTLFDKGCVTSSLVDYPYYMTFFSTSRKLEIEGVPFATPDPKPTRREALAYYRRVVDHYGLDVRQYEGVTEISGEAGDFTLTTQQRGEVQSTYRAKALVVAIGGFHKPNFLGVPGEGMDKVLHYYREPWPFYDQDVLVVGAGNSSVESALECYRAGSRVSMVHFEDKIEELLGFPTHDPHGSPIPNREGQMEMAAVTTLADLSAGEGGVIDRVSDGNPKMLSYLGKLGMYPGAAIELIEREPYGGPIRIKVAGKDEAIGPELAENVFITVEDKVDEKTG